MPVIYSYVVCSMNLWCQSILNSLYDHIELSKPQFMKKNTKVAVKYY